MTYSWSHHRIRRSDERPRWDSTTDLPDEPSIKDRPWHQNRTMVMAVAVAPLNGGGAAEMVVVTVAVMAPSYGMVVAVEWWCWQLHVEWWW
mmetsp:Transcript_20472/g.47381  ORF Transcript_20472/g.47381 Transcript_20472/m.47381 type:complete len:91 (-) Transcript_20472:128-400(-)